MRSIDYETRIENGIKYELIDDIWYPKLESKNGNIRLGEYGLLRLKYLEQHKSGLYEQLFLEGELFSHCKELEFQAKQMKYAIVKQCLAKDMDLMQAFDIAEETVKHEFDSLLICKAHNQPAERFIGCLSITMVI